ncbi:hypothetical protein T484DRAFT_1821723 [Baffinella frigidus]|nr:hypothetical protein T484DRAFT_1821723 [Cryptophyta sp. CCMP2293]
MVSPNRNVVVQFQNPSKDHVNSAVVVQFQNPSKDLRDQMAMQVISSVIDQPFFADLRTKQQLG